MTGRCRLVLGHQGEGNVEIGNRPRRSGRKANDVHDMRS